MKRYLLMMSFVFSSTILAKNVPFLSFHRTNYYTHKTYVFDVSMDSSCQIKANNPLRSYFVVQLSAGKKYETLSGTNARLFTPKISAKNSRQVVFSLDIFNHALFKATYPKNVQFRLSAYPSSSGCQTQLESFIDGQMIHDNLKRIEAELILHQKGLQKGHPKGLSWLKFLEPSGSDCLVGSCK